MAQRRSERRLVVVRKVEYITDTQMSNQYIQTQIFQDYDSGIVFGGGCGDIALANCPGSRCGASLAIENAARGHLTTKRRMYLKVSSLLNTTKYGVTY